MEFGVPKEVRDRERRVALTPAGVLSLKRAGHRIYIEHDAGADAGFSDHGYEEAGGEIVYSSAEAYGRADIVVKVARPTAREHELSRPGQIIFSFFYLPVASSHHLHAMQEREITAIAFEMILEDDGRQPVLLPASEVAGRLAPIIAGHALMNDNGGRGVLLSGVPGVPPAAVVILGAGVLGVNAARAFLGLRAEITVLDRDLRRLHDLDDLLNGRATTMLSNNYNIRRAVSFADVLIGAVHTHGARAPILVTEDMVKRMRPGSLIIDFSINSGGCVETSRPTTLRDPVYVTHNVLHHCVPNITSSVARTASYALNNAALPYLRDMGELGLERAVRERSAIRRGINLYQGALANPDLAAALGRPLEIDLTAEER
ncbi:MAG: alanine dehydrogenase [Caldilineaceae bacterium]|nr:alanine dehydrogenase [Caldilineaceae bacterium]